MTEPRKQAEEIIYSFFDKLDTTGLNTQYYKEMFLSMSDKQFEDFCKKQFPFRFQQKPFVTEPTMYDIHEALKVIDAPLLEKVNLNYMYKKDGKAVQSPPALVVYIPLKKMKQFISKKNSMSTTIGERDMKTGLLTNKDKNAIESDREFESLAIMGLETTMKEFSKPRADAMKMKSEMYQAISTKGMVSMDDLHDTIDDSIAKNTINTYLIGAQLFSNMIGDDYMLPYTIRNKGNRITHQ